MNHQQSQADRAQQQAGNAVGAGRGVLVVEDVFFLADQIEDWLLDGGFEVVDVVHPAEDAFGVAEAERPDLVIMDIRLASAADGISAALAILDRTGIRCIFATAYADEPTRARGEKARPFAWLRKPFTADALLGEVKAAFGPH
jgi:two-component system, response regulator PdtaR